MRRMCLENRRLRKLCGELQVEVDRKGVKQRDLWRTWGSGHVQMKQIRLGDLEAKAYSLHSNENMSGLKNLASRDWVE